MTEEKHYIDMIKMDIYNEVEGIELDEGIIELKRLAEIVDEFHIVRPSSRDVAAMQQILDIISIIEIPVRLPGAEA